MRAPPNHVAMMQIDCEVINTRLIHVREDAIPMHLSAQMRTSSNSDSSKPGNLSAGGDDGRSGGKDSFDSASSGNETSSGGGSAPFADFAYENDVYGEGDSASTGGGRGVGSEIKDSKMPRPSKKLYKRKRPSRNGGQGL